MIIRCRSCGSNIRYDIERKKMHCEYCGNDYDPQEFRDDSESFDAVTYTCRSCGAELITSDNTEATAFCSYCGSTSILTGRLDKIKKPERILPFRVTKERCREIYLNKAKKTFLAPGWLKKEDCVDSFRAIYMPYWTYSVRAKGVINRKEVSEATVGNKIYTTTTTYKPKEIDQSIAGWSHDASTAFADDISESIGFAEDGLKNTERFSEAYLSGFYADMAEEPQQSYKEMAADAAKAKLEAAVPGGTFEGEMTVSERTLCYMPVWFMSLRHGNTLTYAAVNGYSGKIVADFPISTRGFFTLAGVLSAAVAALLSLLIVLRPEPAFWVAFILAMIGLLVCGREEKKAYDISAVTGVPITRYYTVTPENAILFMILCTLAAGVMFIISLCKYNGLTDIIQLGWIALFILFFVLAIRFGKKIKGSNYIPRRTVFSCIACLCSGLLLLTRSNVWVYAAALLEAAILCCNCLAAFRIHQKIASRRPPHFDRKGAERHA